MEIGVIKSRIRAYMRRFWKQVPELNLGYLIIVLLLVAAVVFWREYVVIFTMAGITAAVGFLMKRAGLNKLGVETVTFFTVFSGYIYGPRTGAFIGFFLILAQLVTGRPGSYILWVVPTYVLAGYVSGTVTGYSIAFLGPAISAAAQSIFVFFTFIVSREKLGKYTQYAVFNVVFNLILFTTVGPPVVELLSAGPI